MPLTKLEEAGLLAIAEKKITDANREINKINEELEQGASGMRKEMITQDFFKLRGVVEGVNHIMEYFYANS